MTLDEYIKAAVKTESNIDEVKINPDLIVNVLYLFNAAGRMLDQIKKHAFYGKPYSQEQFSVDYASCVSALQALTLVRVRGSSEEMEEETHDQINPRLFHAIVGIATESTELTEALYNTLIGGKVDLVNLREENGDLNWYQAVFYDTMKDLGFKGTWEDDLEKNIHKLQKKRYRSGKFTKDEAFNRDTKDEISVYEQMEELIEIEKIKDS